MAVFKVDNQRIGIIGNDSARGVIVTPVAVRGWHA
jgi:hypothetical protein